MDQQDRCLLEQLARRFQLVAEIAREKRDLDRPLRDGEREHEVRAEWLARAVDLDLDASLVDRFFQLVVGHSVRLQYRAYGPREDRPGRAGLCLVEGIDPAPAAERYFASLDGLELIRFEDADALLTALVSEEIGRAFLPLVRPDGSVIAPVVDALARHEVALVGEEHAAPGAPRARFAVAARRADVEPADEATWTAFVVSPADGDEGAVLCISLLAEHGVRVARLRQVPGSELGEALLLVVAHGPPTKAPLCEALDRLRPDASFLRVLGSYPLHDEVPAPAESGPPAPATKPVAANVAAIPPRAKSPGYTLVSRESRPEPTVIRIGDTVLGGGRVVIAGPCAVESEEQIRECARVVRHYGGSILRGGAFKPRTSPYSFQGMGYPGLELLRDAAREHGLSCVTEVMSPADVEAVQEYADILQIGARNMQNYPLLREVGRSRRPVLLKRGLAATIDEWLYAAEYILAEGNQRVVLCERGIRTFSSDTRFTLDIAAVPIVRERTHLPVIVDPSHAAGDWRYVAPMARAALAIGCDGLMVEIHPDRGSALSDGSQALGFEQFGHLMVDLGMAPAPASEGSRRRVSGWRHDG